MSARAVLILAGGAGTRLWPLSTDARPKQFLELFGRQSLLQKTFERYLKIVPAGSIFLSTNERYGALVEEQLPALPVENILLEPARKNTAPAIAVCCGEIARRLPGVTIGIFPSDHAIRDEAAFRTVVETAFRFAENNPYLVTIGIRPDEPNTGFGYLELGHALDDGVVALRKFVEKPDRASAEEFIRSGNFVWNGGMFLWSFETFRAALMQSAPEIERLAAEFVAETDPARKKAIYESMPSISIDFGVMEKAPNGATVPGEFGWSDLGTWKAVADYAGSNPPQLRSAKSSGLYVLSSDDKPIVVVGVNNVAIIDSANGLLVLNLDETEALSPIVNDLEQS